MNTLLDTDDPEVWAAEFCRIFSGKMIALDDMSEAAHGPVTPTTMAGWFATAMATAIKLREPVAEAVRPGPEELDYDPLDPPDEQKEAFLEGFEEGRPPQ